MVVDARLNLFCNQVASPGSVRVMRATPAISIASMTWNSYLPLETQIAPVSGSQWVPMSVGWHQWDVTEAFALWQAQATPGDQCTIRLQATIGGHMAFSSSDHMSVEQRPRFVVEYAPIPQVSITSPAGGDVSEVPSVSWQYSEALGNPQVQYEVAVSLTQGGAPVATASGTTATSCAMPAPSGGWQTGTTYHVRVRAASSPKGGTSRVWSAWSNSTFRLVAPPAVIQRVSVQTTATSGWFAEADTNGDGVSDARNDSANTGRGAVTLSWAPVTGATGYRVYLFDGNVYRQMADITETSWTSAGRGLFPADTAIASMPDSLTANPFLSGTGLDLRDDPRPLYARTAGTEMDDVPAYAFKVVPYNVHGSASTTATPATIVALDSRTAVLNPAVHNTTAEIGQFAEHRVEAVLNTESMRTHVTDLSIASHGPDARLSRVYDSARPNQGLFGPGWRFNFEQTIEQSGNVATYLDEEGDAYRFLLRDGLWHAPEGYRAELTREFVNLSADLGWRLRFRGGGSLLFDAAGRLVEERDTNGNTVYYHRPVPDRLDIVSPNSQSIVVSFAGGRITGAVYATPDGTRTVAYSATATSALSATNTVTYFPGTSDVRTVNYSYTGTIEPGTYYLSRVSISEIPAATWGFDARPRPVSWSQGNAPAGAIEWGQGRVATTVKYGSVRTDALALAGEIRETFEWNPTGTTARRSNPHAVGDAVRWRTFIYTRSGDITREVDPAGHSRTWLYDTRGNMITQTDEEGASTTYVYGTIAGALDRVVEEISPSGARTSRNYDASGNVLSEERDLNSGERARTEWTYDAFGRTVSETRAISSTETVTTRFGDAGFAPNGEPLQVSRPGVMLSFDATTPVTLTERSSYDAFGNLVSRTDAEGFVTETNTYTLAGHLALSRNASGTATTNTHDALGRVITSGRQAGGQVVDRVGYTYDALGNVTREDYFLDGAVAFSIMHNLDTLGRARSTTHTIEGVTTRWHNAAGNIVAEWSPVVPLSAHGADLSRATRTVYDALGRVTHVMAPGNTTGTAEVTTYSASGRVLSTESADGQRVVYAYDASGNRISETRPTEGDITVTDTFVYDLAGRLIESVKAAGTKEAAVTSFTYDLLGRQISAELGKPSTTVYNALSWVLAETDFDGIQKRRTFDRRGLVTSESIIPPNGAGRTTRSVYDGLGRTVAVTDPADRTVQTGYDAFGRVASETHRGRDGSQIRRIETAYDGLSRSVATTQSPAGVRSTFAYAGGTRRVSTATVEHLGLTTTILYDQLGHESTRTVRGTGVSLEATVTARDNEGRRLNWRVAGRPGSARYDAAGKLIEQTAPGIDAVYTYDADTGRKIEESVTVTGASSVRSAYTYTGSGRLASARLGSAAWDYTFDERGNLTRAVSGGVTSTFSVTDTASPAATDDRLRRSTRGSVETTYANDALGRRTSSTSGGVTTSFGWDDASRLVTWRRGSSAATYTYDAAGQRTQTVLTEGSRTTTTTYAYDGITLLSLAATQGASAWRIAYLYDEQNRPYAAVHTSGTATPTTFHIATNDRGDVVALATVAGAVFARYTYDPYGAVISHTANGVANSSVTTALATAIAARQPLRYAGYVYDAHSQTYYLSQRHYDPATMRFLSKDPARADGEESAYQYCAGDPVGKVDPTGLVSQRIQSLWRAVVRERPSPEWILRVPVLNFIPAIARGTWYLENARWFFRTARAIVYNEMRTTMPARWLEARHIYVSTMGEEMGLLEYFSNHPHPDYSWFKRRYLGDAARMARIAMFGIRLGQIRRWA